MVGFFWVSWFIRPWFRFLGLDVLAVVVVVFSCMLVARSVLSRRIEDGKMCVGGRFHFKGPSHDKPTGKIER